jgi:hypothetical protein
MQAFIKAVLEADTGHCQREICALSASGVSIASARYQDNKAHRLARHKPQAMSGWRLRMKIKQLGA